MLSCSFAQDEDVKLEEKSFENITLGVLDRSIPWDEETTKQLSSKWETGSVPIVLELGRMARGSFINDLYDIMGDKTGQKFGGDNEKWQNWLWKQEFKPLAGYPEFKAELYKNIDPKFEAYFNNDAKSTIRLDEVVWGGVVKDGIPPLRDPKMRAYPKRILAWHEMFTDTIQKVPLAGVY